MGRETDLYPWNLSEKLHELVLMSQGVVDNT